MVELLYSSGCRVTELERLDITDIDFDKREVKLFGKGNKHRTSYLSAKAIVALQAYLASRQDDCPSLFVTSRLPIRRMQNLELRLLFGNWENDVKFLISANAGEALGRISKIASGGELSRIMLAMKTVFSKNDPIETMVFDEIDTGVSGIAAQRVGEKMSDLSRGKQVLCITPLPQIAAIADNHDLIEKTERNGRTYTEVRELDRKGRALELARMHGGDNISELTLASAEEQLLAADKYRLTRNN